MRDGVRRPGPSVRDGTAVSMNGSYVHDYSYRLVFGPYATRSLPMDYEAWFLKRPSRSSCRSGTASKCLKTVLTGS